MLEALAQGYIHSYRLGNAMDCLNRLLEREPNHLRALIWRASLWQAAGKDAQAEADYRRAIEAQPDHVGARCRLGEFLLRHTRADEALLQYKYLRPRPGGDQPAVLLGLARSHRGVGATDTARQVLDELLAGHPHDGDPKKTSDPLNAGGQTPFSEALVERAKLALESESPAAAESWARRAVAGDPFNAQANYLLAQSLRRQGKDDEAREYEAAQERIESDRKRLESALARVGKAPSDPEPRLEAGLIRLRNGNEREGLRWLLSALKQAPQHRPTHAALADYYEQAGKPELAAKHRRQAQQSGASSSSP